MEKSQKNCEKILEFRRTSKKFLRISGKFCGMFCRISKNLLKHLRENFINTSKKFWSKFTKFAENFEVI